MHLILFQMLTITCDNASSNDTMTLELKNKVCGFDGQAAQVWCFLHVGNLVGKTMVKAFDIPKDMVERDDELKTLGAEGLDVEDWQTIAENGEDLLDDTECWVNEIPLLTHVEHADLEDQVRPVWIVLTKVGLTFRNASSVTSNPIRYGSCLSRLFIPPPPSCPCGTPLALIKV